jgi:hypothetical protein
MWFCPTFLFLWANAHSKATPLKTSTLFHQQLTKCLACIGCRDKVNGCQLDRTQDHRVPNLGGETRKALRGSFPSTMSCPCPGSPNIYDLCSPPLALSILFPFWNLLLSRTRHGSRPWEYSSKPTSQNSHVPTQSSGICNGGREEIKSAK